jgi:N-acetylglucosamine repressor
MKLPLDKAIKVVVYLIRSLNKSIMLESVTMTYSKKGDRNLIKQMNQQLVLQIIQGRGPISRRDITQISGLSPATVSGITSILIDRGLVHEVGEAEETGRAGRRAVLLRLDPHAGYVVGVKLAVHTISSVLTDLDANVLHFVEHILPKGDPATAPFNPDATVQATIAVVENLLDLAKIEPTRLLGIGVGVNGIVDVDTGVSSIAPHFGWRNVPLAAPLAAHFGVPVHLENDSRTLTIAEQWFGSGREVDHFIAVTVGYGIGAGVVANKQLYRGASGGAGEFGHITLQADGPLCSCGKRGCLESFAAVPAIFRQIEEALAAGESSVLAGSKPLTLEAVAQAAHDGDALAHRVVATAGRWLGFGLVSLVNILNPELIVVNGEAVGLGRPYFEAMEAVLREYAFDGLVDSLRIITEPSGNEMWARGAACVALSSLFTSSDHQRIGLINSAARLN